MGDKNMAVLAGLKSRTGKAQTGQVTILAHLHAKNGLAGTLKEKLIALSVKTHGDGGCINYDLHQAVDDEGHFMFYERWESQSHLDKHLAAPYVQAFFEEAKNLLTVPADIKLWNRVP